MELMSAFLMIVNLFALLLTPFLLYENIVDFDGAHKVQGDKGVDGTQGGEGGAGDEEKTALIRGGEGSGSDRTATTGGIGNFGSFTSGISGAEHGQIRSRKGGFSSYTDPVNDFSGAESTVEGDTTSASEGRGSSSSSGTSNSIETVTEVENDDGDNIGDIRQVGRTRSFLEKMDHRLSKLPGKMDDVVANFMTGGDEGCEAAVYNTPERVAVQQQHGYAANKSSTEDLKPSILPDKLPEKVNSNSSISNLSDGYEDMSGETSHPESIAPTETIIHEKFATLLIIGSVFNLFCEFVYTVEAPYSGRFFVIMNVVRHSLAFLSSVKNSFIAARLPVETRAMCLSFFSLTSEVSRAVGCYLFANVLFDPSRKGWAAGAPFRFAFLMYFIADIIYIYVFYTYRDPRTALEKRGKAAESEGMVGVVSPGSSTAMDSVNDDFQQHQEGGGCGDQIYKGGVKRYTEDGG